MNSVTAEDRYEEGIAIGSFGKQLGFYIAVGERWMAKDTSPL